MSVEVIVAKDVVNCDKLIGTFLDESHYDRVIDSDCDFYAPAEVTLFGSEEETEEKCVFKFRKGFFTIEEQMSAYEGLKDAASPSFNRGMAAGQRNGGEGGAGSKNREWVTDRQVDILDLMINPIDSLFETSELEKLIFEDGSSYKGSSRGLAWLSSKMDDFVFDDWAKETFKLSLEERRVEAQRVSDEFISKTTYANQVYSGVAGWFDRYPRIPYGRATAYTQNNKEKFEKSYPLLKKLASGFKALLPERYANQIEACTKIDPGYYIPETPFTTLTINKTFRTAAHLDAGDLAEGFSNLCVLTNGVGYKGGYLVLPEFRVAINIRPGDLLLVANHSGIHGNTEIKVEEGGERISLVCYFREKMLELGEKVYEDVRFEFVESRRKNEAHPHWRPMWNGVSAGMFESEEWYDFLASSLGEEMMKKYHPNAAPRKQYSDSCSYITGGAEAYDCSKCNKVCTGSI